MGAVGHALAAMDTDKDITDAVLGDGLYRAGRHAAAAPDAQGFILDDTTAPAGAQAASGTDRGAGWRVASKADRGFKAGGQPARRGDADARMFPGQKAMHLPGARQGTAMAANAALHVGGKKSFHKTSTGGWETFWLEASSLIGACVRPVRGEMYLAGLGYFGDVGAHTRPGPKRKAQLFRREESVGQGIGPASRGRSRRRSLLR